jgi:energy-coupling factor transporter transmembrane protein EcfT
VRIAMPHPVTQITIWICLAIVVQALQSELLLPMLAATLGFVAFKAHPSRLLALLRRTRWILVSLLVIYAFFTPGIALWSIPYVPNPTQEGMLDGLVQLSRLVCMLAGLSILLTMLSLEQLVSGLYALLYPLRYVGVSRERIAVRLALTLRYAEKAMQDTAKDWRSGIEHALEFENQHEAALEFPMQMLTWVDAILLMVISAILIGVWR